MWLRHIYNLTQAEVKIFLSRARARERSYSFGLFVGIDLGIGVPYGSRTRVAAVKEKGPIIIQWNFAARVWVSLGELAL
jgi:hypothetical protein